MCPRNKVSQLGTQYFISPLIFSGDYVFVFFNGFVVIIINYHYNYLWMTDYTFFANVHYFTLCS